MVGKRVARWLAVSLFVGALLRGLEARSVVLADDTEIGATGGAITPIRSADIRLEAETVQAVCFGLFAEYRVDFRFFNDGARRRVTLGFPFTDTVSGEEDTERPFGFQAWQDGRPLSVRAVAARPGARDGSPGYFQHVALLRHGATMITVSYLSSVSGTAVMRIEDAKPGDPGYGMASWYQYWLHTGSTWKGPIGKAVVRYRFADTFRGGDVGLTADQATKDLPVPLTSPLRWTRPLPRTYQWEFTDFDPTPARPPDWWMPQSRFDVTLGFATSFRASSTDGRWTWSSAAGGFGDTDYCPLQDGSLSSCWAEGVPGPGIGQWVQARFRRPVHLRELRILPGNNAYDAAFRRYGRPRTVTAVFSDGTSTFLSLKDSPVLQRFPVDVATRSVRLVIRAVYAGTDYPGTCISEVEFGRRRAPRYAAFARLVADPHATGRLGAWAGPAAPPPRAARRAVDWREELDAEAVAGGNLIGVSDWAPFPADVAPFRQPASLAALAARAPALRLPGPSFVGRVVAVNALSSLTYEVRYSTGVDLLVNTDVSKFPAVSLLSELTTETRSMLPYADHRGWPFELAMIGRQRVGFARAGRVASDCVEWEEGDGVVPAQVFWQADGMSYHLYARSQAVTMAQLIFAARSMIEPGSQQLRQGPAVSPRHGGLRAPLLGALLLLAAAGGLLLGMRVRLEA